jgi:replicative DNA helicase
MNPFDLNDVVLPPHSVEAEQAFVGILLDGASGLDRVRDIIVEPDLYRADHRAIYRQIIALADANEPVDVVTVGTRLERLGELDQAGGMAYLTTLVQHAPAAVNIRRHAEEIAERAKLRALQTAAKQILDDVDAPGIRTAAEIAADAERTLSVFVAADRGGEEPTTAADAMAAVLRDADNGAAQPGLQTGIDDLDHLTGGLEPGQLIIPAARPAVGKTAVALAIARHVAGNGGRVAFFSLEMTRRELASRLLSAESGIPARVLRTGPNPGEWAALADAATKRGHSSLVLDDRAAASVAYIRARCRRLNRQGKLALIVVDYLQLMTPENPRATRNEQVGSLSRGLKALAKELHVPIIALAQLNRTSESRADKRPMLSDLRDSGEVEQDADAVLLLHRATEAGDILECNLAKHRQGPTGTFYLDFDGARMRLSRRYGPPEGATTKSTRPARGFSE